MDNSLLSFTGPTSVLCAPRSRYRSINSATPNRERRRMREKLRNSLKGIPRTVQSALEALRFQKRARSERARWERERARWERERAQAL